MLDQAIAKIEAEIKQNITDGYVTVIGEFLLKYLESNPAAAEKIMADGKTINKSVDELEKASKAKRKGNRAVISDQEAYAIVLKYFGIEDAGINTHPVDRPKPAAEPKKTVVDFDIDLDELLA